MATTITSNDKIPVDCHFKVKAGPGAGKTHWLINHINNVLAHSGKRLGKCGKIACITYTNVAVDTITNRLGGNTNVVEVCTIHSFFYNHIVKPYLRYIADEEGFNLDLLKGEDDRYDLSYTTLQDIKQITNQQYANDSCLKKALGKAKWKIEKGNIICNTDYAMPSGSGNLKLSPKTYLAYKKIAWSKGLMHYDDTIYFAYKVITKFSFLQEVIARKFPFMFIDEFQDSHPIQVRIIKMIANSGTTIGVIGDPAQSIYGFLGAEVKQFNAFSLAGLQEYIIEGNRRSSIRIVDFLNKIRTDLQQKPQRTNQGYTTSVFVGNHVDNYQKLLNAGIGDVCVLSYDNVNANSLKKMTKGVNVTDNHLIDKITDSDEKRKNTVATFVKVLEHAKMGNFKKAFNFMSRLDFDVSKAVIMLQAMLANYDSISKMSLYDFYCHINNDFSLGMSAMRKGKAQTFYSSHPYLELAMCVSHEEDDGLQRTIHKAKGDEFDNVLVCLGEDKLLEILLTPDLESNESHRVYYVAASRARERLFFSIPTLSDENRMNLENKGLKIETA